MRIPLISLIAFIIMKTSAFSGVYVVEGFEEFEAASFYEIFNLIEDKIDDDDKAVRRKAVRFLSNLFTKQEIVLGHYLKEGSKIRLLTHNTIKIEDIPDSIKDKAVENLIAVTAYPDFYTRKIAIRALGKSGDRRAIEPLKFLLAIEENPNILKEINNALNNLATEPPIQNDEDRYNSKSSP